ncbi:MAG: dTMP kinase [Clostridia bacterium]|nr:dTMP kinase [Clostridia bacterium]
MPTKKKGSFITFEGCEGSGKSTQLALLKEHFVKNGIDAMFTREPGGTVISEKLREIILSSEFSEMNDRTEALLYAAARVQLIDEKIAPYVEKGGIVVCDRYIDSSFAYQAFARGLGMEYVKSINSYAIENRMPDATIFFDISPEEAFGRKGGAEKGDRLEQSGMEFHDKVYRGYLEICRLYPERIVVIDAHGSAEEIFVKVIDALKKRGII